MRTLMILLLCAHLMMPLAANAQAALRAPLSVPLSEYGLMLAISILGALISWIRKVRKGEIPNWSFGYLVGEMTMAAFTGLIIFWLCEWRGWSMNLTAALCGLGGLMSAKLLSLAEEFTEKMAAKKMRQVTGDSGPAPLGRK